MDSRYYVGIFEGHADPAVAIVSGGRLLAYAEEERFIRNKHAFGIYPMRALKFCLDTAGIGLSDVAAVGLNWDVEGYTNGRMQDFFDTVNGEFDVDDGTKGWQRSMISRFSRDTTERRHQFEWRKAFGDIEFPPIVDTPHHYVHAFQASQQSGFGESLCLTIDGSGDEHCTVLWVHRGGELEPILQRHIPHSLGWFYAAFTEYLGFRAYNGEYKVMGLAAYGKEDRALKEKVAQVLEVLEGEPFYRIDPAFIHYGPHTYSTRYTDNLVDLFGRPPRLPSGEFDEWHEDLAFAVQGQLEEAAVRIVEWGVERTGIDRVTIGGGVGLNVKMNSRIFDLPNVTDVWANPLCSDGGAAVGAAFAAAHKDGEPLPERLLRLDYGNAEDDIESVLKSAKVSYKRSDNIARDTAELLADGRIVGWFQGRMEAGPRSLGQRSILADPRDVASRDKVNAVIKFREYWRPFCPSVLEERAADYLKEHTDARFMVIAFCATDKFAQDAPAVVHVDGTARVQLVSQDALPLYHRLISEFESITGVGALLNTSFNVKGEPIVCTVRDALRTFWSTGLDALAAGDFLITKPEAGDA